MRYGLPLMAAACVILAPAFLAPAAAEQGAAGTAASVEQQSDADGAGSAAGDAQKAENSQVAETAEAAAAPAVNLYPDMTEREMIRAVQRELRKRRYYRGGIDGIAGPRTNKAVTEWQKAAGARPDGRIDGQLLARLRALDTFETAAGGSSDGRVCITGRLTSTDVRPAQVCREFVSDDGRLFTLAAGIIGIGEESACVCGRQAEEGTCPQEPSITVEMSGPPQVCP